MSDLGQLLVVQELDNTLEALRHRLGTLPERAALDVTQNAIAAIDRDLAVAEAPRRELEREQRRFEDEVSMLRARAEQENAKLYGGAVTAVRELQALQEEIDSLKRRAAQQEDRIIELMERIEPLVASGAGMRASRDELEATAQRQTVARAEAEAAIEAELRAATDRRAAALADTPPDAFERYTLLRPGLAPSTVVRLVGNRCEGCPLAMPAMEVDRIRKQPAGLAECDECGRLVLH